MFAAGEAFVNALAPAALVLLLVERVHDAELVTGRIA